MKFHKNRWLPIKKLLEGKTNDSPLHMETRHENSSLCPYDDKKNERKYPFCLNQPFPFEVHPKCTS
jgi:hypothetical protein